MGKKPPLPHKDFVARIIDVQARQRGQHGLKSYVAWTDVADADLQNGWAAFDAAQATYPLPGYMKASDGLVTLRGVISGGSSGGGVVIFTLPEGFRPAYRTAFAVATGTGATQPGRVDVDDNGSVIAQSISATGFVSLDGVRFIAEA